MPITAEYLQERIAELRLTIALHNGAIQFAEHLLQQLEEERAETGDLTAEQFAEMVAGPGARVEGITHASNGQG